MDFLQYSLLYSRQNKTENTEHQQNIMAHNSNNDDNKDAEGNDKIVM